MKKFFILLVVGEGVVEKFVNVFRELLAEKFASWGFVLLLSNDEEVIEKDCYYN